jgi:hypothetical protein
LTMTRASAPRKIWNGRPSLSIPSTISLVGFFSASSIACGRVPALFAASPIALCTPCAVNPVILVPLLATIPALPAAPANLIELMNTPASPATPPNGPSAGKEFSRLSRSKS